MHWNEHLVNNPCSLVLPGHHTGALKTQSTGLVYEEPNSWTDGRRDCSDHLNVENCWCHGVFNNHARTTVRTWMAQMATDKGMERCSLPFG